MIISSLWVVLFLSRFSGQNSVEKAYCRTTQNMNITKPVSWEQNFEHGWGHYLLEYMEDNIF